LRDVETIIIGGGPAGSSCARELIRHGRECIILERQTLPKFKLCAGWITPKVIHDLEIGIPSSEESRSSGWDRYPYGILELRQIRLYLGRSKFHITFPTLQYSIRRIEFDNWLLERCGAESIRHSVRSITLSGGNYIVDDEYRCRYLVGAGGTNCPVKRAFFENDLGQLIITQEIEFETKPESTTCTLFYPYGGLAGYGWYVPKVDGINIGFGGAAAQFKGNIKLLWNDFVKTLRQRGLLHAEPPEPSSHPYYVGDRLKDVRRGNAFIVGDAAGLATLDMGEGIGPAIESGILAARQILGESEYALSQISHHTLEGLPGKIMAGLVRLA
jgi:flavin-dependent dehydrogenase